MRPICLLTLAPLFWSCSSAPDPLFRRIEASKTGIDFANTIEETATDNVLNYEYFYNGGGVAAADFNNDGLTDLYFTANQGPDKLYLNRSKDGSLTFEDATKQAGISWNGEWKTGVTVVDINQDGWQDIYVSVSGNVNKPHLRRNKLYINNGTNAQGVSFTEKAAEYGLDLNTFTTQTAFFDYDKDGDLDAYILNHNVKDFNRFDVEAVRAMRDSLAGDRLLRNENGRFVDVSTQEGIKGNPIGFGLGIHTADLNGDGWTDIYVSNDYIENDYLYINQGNRRLGGPAFTDQITRSTNHVSYFSMGNEVGDINNDLLPDIITMDMLPEDNRRQKLLFGPDRYEGYLSMLRNGIHPQTMRNMLQLNNGNGPDGTPFFSEIGQLAGISNTDWSWSPLLADFDNDGHKDLFITNGYLRDYTNNDFIKYYADERQNNNKNLLEIIQRMPSTRTPNYLFRNNGTDPAARLTFTNKQKDWGFEEEVISNGAISADLDNDGDLDLVTNNLNEQAFVYLNQSNEQTRNGFLTVALRPGATSTPLHGAKVYVFAQSLRQVQELTPTHSFQSANLTPLHFGLGNQTKADSMVVVWPDGSAQRLLNVPANQRLTITYAPGGTRWQPFPNPEKPLFAPSDAIMAEHTQLPLNDFSRQLLLPQMYSYQGPRLAKGDVNGDGLDDLYLGGGRGQTGQVLLQTKQGAFVPKPQPAFAPDALCTDTDALLFDADGDRDLDLYVVSGGYEYLADDLLLQNRLYRNDGKGNFTKDPDALEPDNQADTCVEPIDYDNDGDLDLFVGGSVVPRQYPYAYPSALYENQKGRFIKVEQPALAELGILNDAIATDIDRDGDTDLVAVGEWTDVIWLRNDKGTFSRASLYALTGLWQRITTNDFDRDGDMDLIVGNYGLNTQWRASVGQPMSLAFADFDKNGRIDPILSYFIQGVNYPAYSRDELLDQLVPLKKVYTNYETYALTTMTDVLKNLGNPTPDTRQATTLSTVYLVNDGKGAFSEVELPIEAQFAPVCALLSHDVNADGFPDLVLGGNQSHGRVRVGNIDASFGQLLLNDHKGNFTFVPQHRSGLQLRGDVRDFVQINRLLVAGINNRKAQAYSF